MATFVNTSFESRIWHGLKDPTTGTTLELAPNQSVELEVPSDFYDRYLVPTSPSKTKKVHKSEHPVEAQQTDDEESSEPVKE